MKRKIILTLITVCILSFASCGEQETTVTVETTVESTQVETAEQVESTEETEAVESNTTESETETVEESTEAVESTEETTDIENGEPLSEKDLAFSFFGYNTYKEYIEAGNNGNAYIVADNAAMIMSGEFTDDGDVLESTVRGIKLGDSIDKVFELYGQADKYDKCTKKFFAHDDLEDTDQYTYFLKLDSTKDYFYAFTFYADQYSDVIGLIIEPISMKYWTGNKAQ